MGLDTFDKETERLYGQIKGATPYTRNGPLLARKVRPKPKALPGYSVLDAFKTQSPAYYNAAKSVKDAVIDAYGSGNATVNAVVAAPGELVASIQKNGVRNSSADMYAPGPIHADASESFGTSDARGNFTSFAQGERIRAAALPGSAGPTARPRLGDIPRAPVAAAFSAPNYAVAGSTAPVSLIAPQPVTAPIPAPVRESIPAPVTAPAAPRPAPAAAQAPAGNGSYWIDSSGVKRDLTWDNSGNITSGLRNAADPNVRRDRAANNAALRRSL